MGVGAIEESWSRLPFDDRNVAAERAQKDDRRNKKEDILLFSCLELCQWRVVRLKAVAQRERRSWVNNGCCDWFFQADKCEPATLWLPRAETRHPAYPSKSLQ